MLHPAGALEEREPRPNKENWHLTGYGAHENPILGRHPWTRFSLSAAVLCCSHLYGSRQREQAPHDTQQGPSLVGSAGDVQDAGLACLALPADPCPCCPPKHLRLPWFVVQPCVGGSHCQVILQRGAPLGDPLAILCRARIGQWAGTLAISDTGRAFSHLTLDRPFGSQARRRPVAKGPHSKPPPGTATLSACPWGGAGTLFCILTPCASASRFEDKLRQGPRVIHPGIQLWTRWVR